MPNHRDNSELMDRKIKKKKWTLKKILYITGGVVLLSMIVFQIGWADKRSRLKVDVEKMTIATVNRGVFQEFIPQTGAVVPPIQPSTTFARDEQGALYDSNRIYARDQSVNTEMAEAVLCELEVGADCKLFASGMAAATALVQTLRPGDRLVAPTVMYWSLRAWLISFCDDWGIEIAFYDPADEKDMIAVVKALPTQMLWVETPANPTWQVVDITLASDLAHDVGAQLVVDSTVATPLLTRPIELGADFVFHSATKYINGHSDVVAGALVAAKKDSRWEKLCMVRAQQGGILGPFDSWLLLRGMRTMHVRVR